MDPAALGTALIGLEAIRRADEPTAHRRRPSQRRPRVRFPSLWPRSAPRLPASLEAKTSHSPSAD
jgi:hypothetical protein